MRVMFSNFIRSISPLTHKYYLEYEEMVLFLFKLGLLLFGWKVMFHFVWHNDFLLTAYNNFSLVVIEFILQCCAFLLEIFQYDIEIDSFKRILRLKNTVGVTVGEPCIGYEVTAFFIALILSCKGSIRKKIWFIPFGASVIYLLNLIRICALALLVKIDPAIWELNHKVIFSLIVYSFIFLMWRYWLKINPTANYE